MTRLPQLCVGAALLAGMVVLVVVVLQSRSTTEPADGSLLPPMAASNLGNQKTSPALQDSKTAILLVSHGSHSPTWRKMLGEFHASVQSRLLALPRVAAAEMAFMEYTEPSIATRLKEYDAAGITHVVLIPLLLTVSTHSFDDIPTIIGQKDDAESLLQLKSEGIERYRPRAAVTITPLLDLSTLLESNLPRRIAALSEQPTDEGVVLVAYGDSTYNDEWEAFFKAIGQKVQAKTGAAEVVHCWCGHIVKYSKEPVQNAIRDVLSRHAKAIVIPVLVARDSFFQDEIIGGAIKELNSADRIAYKPDAILPDASLNDWVVGISDQTLQRLSAETTAQRR